MVKLVNALEVHCKVILIAQLSLVKKPVTYDVSHGKYVMAQSLY